LLLTPPLDQNLFASYNCQSVVLATSLQAEGWIMKRFGWRISVRQMMSAVAFVALVLGAFSLIFHTREAAARSGCTNNLGQIGLGLQNYMAANGDVLPYGTVSNPALPPERRLSWYTTTSPYIEQWLWLFDMTEAWDSVQNRVTRGRGVEGPPSVVTEVPVLSCPSSPARNSSNMPGLTTYVGIAGLGKDAPSLPKSDPRAGIFGYDRQTLLADVKDGMSVTMMVVETAAANGPWTAGGPATVRGLDPDRQPYLGKNHQFGGFHPEGLLVLFGDGSVRFIREAIHPRAFEALSTMAGGEKVDPGLAASESSRHPIEKNLALAR
jgi:hypothetical protein